MERMEVFRPTDHLVTDLILDGLIAPGHAVFNHYTRRMLHLSHPVCWASVSEAEGGELWGSEWICGKRGEVLCKEFGETRCLAHATGDTGLPLG